MVIGIHAKAAFKYQRTGVEEYVYQLVKHLAMLDESQQHAFHLYTPLLRGQQLYLPNNFSVRMLHRSLMGEQVALSLEMFLHAPETLFMPASFLPYVYPRNTVATIHGLEFKYYPEIYHPTQLRYIERGTEKVVRNAAKIISVSETTKNDLIKYYNADPRKIVVIPYGVNSQIAYHHKYAPLDEKYILFVGRIEKKKNIIPLIRAFTVLKERKKIPHKLVLVGNPGFGYHEIRAEIEKSVYRQDIVETGYISHEEKESFFKYADLFVLPSLYEGFPMPVLEAQLRQVPVITSRIASTQEIGGEGVYLVDPESVEELSDAMDRIISDRGFRDTMIAHGLANVRKYSWLKCAKETLAALTA